MSKLERHSPPILTVCVLSSLVSVVVTFHVFSERSHGWLAENPSSGSECPPMLICEMPLVYSSRLAPGMPTSVLVVSPFPSVLVTLW